MTTTNGDGVMNLRDLKYIITVAESRHFGKAAERLFGRRRFRTRDRQPVILRVGARQGLRQDVGDGIEQRVIVLVVGLIASRIAGSIVKPLRALSDAARRLSRGEREVSIRETSFASEEVNLLTRTFNDFLKRSKFSKKLDIALSGDDVREGLTAVVSVKVPEPQFEGQTKTKLGNSEVQGIVEGITNEKIGTYFEEHPGVARTLVSKSVQAALAREAARKARDFARADALRDELKARGWAIEDTPKGPKLKKL